VSTYYTSLCLEGLRKTSNNISQDSQWQQRFEPITSGIHARSITARTNLFGDKVLEKQGISIFRVAIMYHSRRWFGNHVLHYISS
jgi:hypothetical protein